MAKNYDFPICATHYRLNLTSHSFIEIISLSNYAKLTSGPARDWILLVVTKDMLPLKRDPKIFSSKKMTTFIRLNSHTDLL